MKFPSVSPALRRLGLWLMFAGGLSGLALLNEVIDVQWLIPLPAGMTGNPFQGDVGATTPVDILPTLCGLAFLTGSVLVITGRVRTEDEMIRQIRLDALLWAVLANQLVLAIAFLFFFGLNFFQVMFFQLFVLPVIFLARFEYLRFRLRQMELG